MDGGTLGLLGVTWGGVMTYIVQHNRSHNKIAEEIGRMSGKMDMLCKKVDTLCEQTDTLSNQVNMLTGQFGLNPGTEE